MNATRWIMFLFGVGLWLASYASYQQDQQRLELGRKLDECIAARGE